MSESVEEQRTTSKTEDQVQQMASEVLSFQTKDIEPVVSEVILSINESAKKLIEYKSQERKYNIEVCTALADYTKQLSLTLEFPPEAFPEFRDAERILLSPQGHLMVFKDRDAVEVKTLEECSSEIVMKVVWSSLPKIHSKIQDITNKMSKRIELIEQINNELKRLSSIEEIKPGVDV